MALGSFDRSDNLARLGVGTYDVLVVGGGVTGAGVALDAAARGLRTALVERDDFASGTSSKSSKLVHGGLRYLQNGDVRLVYEALHERQRLLRNAPHLVKVLPFLIPVFTGKGGLIPKQVARALGSAMWMYDLTGGLRIGKIHRRLKADAARAHMPTLGDRLAWAYLYYDAQTDDARLTLTLARTAAIDFGATVVNHAGVTRLRKVGRPGHRGRGRRRLGHRRGRGARPRGGQRHRRVGRRRPGPRRGRPPRHDPPRQGHPHHRPVGQDPQRHRRGRARPQGPPVGVRRAVARRRRHRGRAGLGHLHRHHRHRLRRRRRRPPVHGRGRRLPARRRQPLGDRTARRERRPRHVGGPAPPGQRCGQHPHGRHVPPPPGDDVSPSGLVTVIGGKLTTYREMAEDAVDAALAAAAQAGDPLPRMAGRSRTRKLRLRGADGLVARPRPRSATSPSATAARPAVLDGHDRRRPGARRPARARPAVPAGRGRLRGALRDGDDPRRRAGPAHPCPSAGPGPPRPRPRPTWPRWSPRARLVGRGAGRPGGRVPRLPPSTSGRCPASPRSRALDRRRPDGRRPPTSRGEGRACQDRGDDPLPHALPTPGPGAPTPPIPLAGGAAAATARLDAERVEVDDALLARLRDACADVTVEPAAVAEASRDWWPLAMAWATTGQVAGLAAAVARPTDADQVAAVLALCHEARVPVTAAGGRSGVCGASVPLHGGVVLDLTAMAGHRRRRPHVAGARRAAGHVRRRARARPAGRPRRHRRPLAAVGGAVHRRRVAGLPGARAALGPLRQDRGHRARPRRRARRRHPHHHRRLAPRRGRARPHPAVRRQRGHARRHHRRPPAAPPGARRTSGAAPGCWARSRSGSTSCGGSSSGAPTRPCCASTTPPRPTAPTAPATRRCSWRSTKATAPLVDATFELVAEECLRAGGHRGDEAHVEHWLAHRNEVAALEALTSKGYTVDTMEVAGSWADLPDDLPGHARRPARRGGDDRRLRPPVAQLPDRRLPVLHVRRPGRRRPARRLLPGAVGRRAAHGPRPRRAPSATTTASASTAAGSWPRPSGPPTGSWSATKAALDPHGILNPGKLGLPSPWAAPTGW